MLQFYAKKSFNEDPQLVEEPPMDRAWVYGASVSDDELRQVAELYSLDSGVLKDVHDKNELPRAEYSQGLLYVFIRAPHQTSRGNIVTVPFLAVLKGALLITLSSKEYVLPSELFAETKIDMKSTKHVFLQLTSHVIARYETFIHQTGAYIENTEHRLRSHEVDNKDFINFVTVEHDLNEYNTNLTALQALLARLRENRHAIFGDKDCEFIEDMLLHVNQLLVATESHKNTISSIRNAYTTISNNTLNLRMKKLTLLTLLIALPNVFFGMFGMNVILPFETEPWAYSAIIGLSVGIVLVVSLFLRKIRF
ncbi:MAG: CorA family divalent cation transporter [Candidatus Saccharimonadaceae bacterium]